MEQNPKERFEEIKKVFYQSDISTLLYKDKIEVTPKFIRDFEYLINLVENLEAYLKTNNRENKNKIEKLKSIKNYEMISYIDIIRVLNENREKINEIIDFNQDSGNHIPHID